MDKLLLLTVRLQSTRIRVAANTLRNHMEHNKDAAEADLVQRALAELDSVQEDIAEACKLYQEGA